MANVSSRLIAAVTVTLAASIISVAARQNPAPQQGGRGGAQTAPAGRQGGGGRGQTFPQFRRPAVDPAVVARGKGLFESNCAACHGIDLRGGQQGGPNLLRSQLILSDKTGDLIGPVILGGRPNPPGGAPPMPPFQFAPDAVQAISYYLHSVLAQAGGQGRPPSAGVEVPPEKILVGDAAAGQKYFAANCSSCHQESAFRGLAARVADARELQNRWVSGGAGGGRGGQPTDSTAPPTMVTVVPANGARIEGRLVRMDDFTVTLLTSDGTRRTFRRSGDDPKVEVREPMAGHHRLATSLSDSDMHNVTAYLWNLK